MTEEKPVFPSRVRLKPDVKKKLSEFMIKENRPFANALDTLLRKALGLGAEIKIERREGPREIKKKLTG